MTILFSKKTGRKALQPIKMNTSVKKKIQGKKEKTTDPTDFQGVCPAVSEKTKKKAPNKCLTFWGHFTDFKSAGLFFKRGKAYFLAHHNGVKTSSTPLKALTACLYPFAFESFKPEGYFTR